MNTLDNVEDASLVTQKILECEKYLTSLSKDEITTNQKLWLLAFKESESRISNLENAEKFADSVNTLKQAIVEGLIK